MSALHIPVGGARFRPCIEDVVQSIAEDLRVDMLPTWRAAVEGGRQRWRERQVRATVRDWQSVAVDELRTLGYGVAVPKQGIPDPPERAVRGW
jgi:hypothetical protein